tara:strand:+ start:278 stop:877 length:600 start_codon:yes stop_codon:yes gene_type:complete
MKLIIVHYNSSDYKKYITRLCKHFDIILYNKTNSKINDANDVKILDIQNIEREGYTYLLHIINNYEILDNFTIFIQDDIDNHINDIEHFIKLFNENKNDFVHYPCTWRKGGRITKRTIKKGVFNLHTFPSNDSIKQVCERFNIKLPDTYVTMTCSFFGVSKQRIHKYSKQFYIALQNWLLENKKNEFVLEHLWHVLFSH